MDYETGEIERFNDTGQAMPITNAVTSLMDADTIIGHNIMGLISQYKKSLPIL